MRRKSSRSGLLVMRLWVEASDPHPRARLSWTYDIESGAGMMSETTIRGAQEALEEVRRCIEGFERYSAHHT